jgi:hypothetical protein
MQWAMQGSSKYNAPHITIYAIANKLVSLLVTDISTQAWYFWTKLKPSPVTKLNTEAVT